MRAPLRACLIPKQLLQHLSDSEEKGENALTPRERFLDSSFKPHREEDSWRGEVGSYWHCPISPLERLFLG